MKRQIYFSIRTVKALSLQFAIGKVEEQRFLETHPLCDRVVAEDGTDGVYVKTRSWLETYTELSRNFFSIDPDLLRPSIKDELASGGGMAGVPDLLIRLTDEFETLNEGREWDGEFYEEIDEFATDKLRV